MQNSGTDTETVKSVDSPEAQIRGMTTYIGTGRESALWKLAPLSLMVYILTARLWRDRTLRVKSFSLTAF